MKVRSKLNKPFIPGPVVGFYQEGGEMVEGEPAEIGMEDPMQQLIMGAQQALETQDCEISMAVCAMLMELVAGAAPQGEAMEPGMEPGMEEPIV